MQGVWDCYIVRRDTCCKGGWRGAAHILSRGDKPTEDRSVQHVCVGFLPFEFPAPVFAAGRTHAHTQGKRGRKGRGELKRKTQSYERQRGVLNWTHFHPQHSAASKSADRVATKPVGHESATPCSKHSGGGRTPAAWPGCLLWSQSGPGAPVQATHPPRPSQDPCLVRQVRPSSSPVSRNRTGDGAALPLCAALMQSPRQLHPFVGKVLKP